MLQRAALERIARALLDQSARGGPLLAPVLHLHGPGGWQHLTLNVATPEELRGSLAEARKLAGLETVDAFVCVVAAVHAAPLAEGLRAKVGAPAPLAYAAQSLAGETAEVDGLTEVREALARMLLRCG